MSLDTSRRYDCSISLRYVRPLRAYYHHMTGTQSTHMIACDWILHVLIGSDFLMLSVKASDSDLSSPLLYLYGLLISSMPVPQQPREITPSGEAARFICSHCFWIKVHGYLLFGNNGSVQYLPFIFHSLNSQVRGLMLH